ncbi:hypothetical protein HT102_01795 [Hoyosella sp. G463]|uniref:Uncharacterized protein n=1 Tax=Lolliginicoccus lacisalsi TaxID=2742202 RepID=A0A927J9L3_9ACTN|nr:hypothetical protein [Lolliginicoccus lacisalsi]MBD8505223.1 hypothetical protein [Lolliginicoccus lacisalsi]
MERSKRSPAAGLARRGEGAIGAIVLLVLAGTIVAMGAGAARECVLVRDQDLPGYVTVSMRVETSAGVVMDASGGGGPGSRVLRVDGMTYVLADEPLRAWTPDGTRGLAPGGPASAGDVLDLPGGSSGTRPGFDPHRIVRVVEQEVPEPAARGGDFWAYEVRPVPMDEAFDEFAVAVRLDAGAVRATMPMLDRVNPFLDGCVTVVGSTPAVSGAFDGATVSVSRLDAQFDLVRGVSHVNALVSSECLACGGLNVPLNGGPDVSLRILPAGSGADREPGRQARSGAKPPLEWSRAAVEVSIGRLLTVSSGPGEVASPAGPARILDDA